MPHPLTPLIRYTLSVAVLVGSALGQPAWAWTGQGHRLVAQLALPQLSPQAITQVQALLALEPGQTLDTVATWADDHRDPDTSAWHYVNFPRGDCHYVAERDCPHGQCVVEALSRQLRLLASDAPPPQRLLALKYVVHFAADIHQPLHAAFGDDRGGNRYQVHTVDGGTNLHALWDLGLGLLDTPDLHRLARAWPPSDPAPLPDIPAIAEASCQLASAPGFYPGHRLTPAYVEQHQPVVQRQLMLAGHRLAAWLNAALD